ncbi:MAG: LacI family DNA-binding transcriptional regulator [Lachnospiraceae bacterium]|nr:LacI family transcriptional regulator [Sarcina sp.]MBR2728461.1 LacI family DNA-binding transcriptional regulator [Lachnospiraceae bacterium]
MGRVTINMIAEKAGVSRGTVDRVLNNRANVRPEVRERILQIARELGYVSPREIHLREQGKENSLLRLGVLLPGWGFGQQFREGVLQGIREAADELENANVEILVKKCRTDLPAEALDLLGQLREEGAEGISVCLLRDPSIEERLLQLKREGVPVVTFNSDLPDSGRILFVGQDIRKSGRLAAQLMSGCIRSGEQVLAAVGNMKFDGHRQRYLGFSERMTELGFPQEDLFTAETFNDYSTTLRVIGEVIRSHPQLGGIYMANLNVSACTEAVRAFGLEKKIHVICHDINDGIRTLLREGRVDFTIPQDFVRQGREPLIWLTSCLRKKDLPDSGRFNDLQILCAENI